MPSGAGLVSTISIGARKITVQTEVTGTPPRITTILLMGGRMMGPARVCAIPHDASSPNAAATVRAWHRAVEQRARETLSTRTEPVRMSVETILTKTMNDVPKVVAAGVVDLATGMLLGVKTLDSHPQEVLDLVAAATKDLFEGDNVTAIEDTFKELRGVESAERYFKEIIVTSTNLLHVFARLKSAPSMVLVAVCRADANLGLAVMKMRAVVQRENI